MTARHATYIPGAQPAPAPLRRASQALLLATALATAVGCGDSYALGIPQEQAAKGRAPASTASGTSLSFTVDATRTTPISPYVYGMNALTDGDGAPANAFPWYGATPPTGVTLNRMGGNRLSAYNWENNFSNAGNDYGPFSNDAFLSGSRTPGEAVRTRTVATFARGAAMLATVPMLGYVAADGNGPTGADEAGRAARLATRFVVSKPRKGSAFTTSPSLTDGAVYQDEFIAWLSGRFPGALNRGAAQPIFVSLDNEPDLWHGTHEEIQSKVGGQPRLLTYAGFVKTTVDYAAAVKSAAPGAVVFGPAVATWAGAATLGRYPSPDPLAGRAFFLDYYLEQLKAAEQSAGRRLVDALDVHWYPAAGTTAGEITNDYAPQSDAMVQARLQAPRSLWDPTYDERSWVNQVQGGPIRLLPLLREKIAARYPGTKIAISEYYYGRGGDISGGVAQADVLGIFGREGVFAATLWPQAGVWAYGGDGRRAYSYIFGAFRMFRDFDGRGGKFGPLSAAATTSDPVRSSVYASADGVSGTAHRVTVIAINKTTAPLKASITIRDSERLTRGEVYSLTAAAATPVRQGDVTVAQQNALSYTMPAMSVSTLVLRP